MSSAAREVEDWGEMELAGLLREVAAVAGGVGFER